MKTINNHLKIQPIEHDAFVASSLGTYDEMGVVLDAGDTDIPIGAVVYFDSWLAKKYQVKGSTTDYHWFVKYEDIVAYEEVSELSV